MGKIELKKFNLEGSLVDGRILNHLDDLSSDLIKNLDFFEGKDFLVHIEYIEKEQKYKFSIYREK